MTRGFRDLLGRACKGVHQAHQPLDAAATARLLAPAERRARATAHKRLRLLQGPACTPCRPADSERALWQGWRLEIKAYPKLTEKGAWRGGAADGSGAYGGFYTQDQARAAAKAPVRARRPHAAPPPVRGSRSHGVSAPPAPFLQPCAPAPAAGLHAPVLGAAGCAGCGASQRLPSGAVRRAALSTEPGLRLPMAPHTLPLTLAMAARPGLRLCAARAQVLWTRAKQRPRACDTCVVAAAADAWAAALWAEDRVGIPQLSRAQVREVVEYAAARFITVVPEIELPGHCRAALACYTHLSCAPRAARPARRAPPARLPRMLLWPRWVGLTALHRSVDLAGADLSISPAAEGRSRRRPVLGPLCRRRRARA